MADAVNVIQNEAIRNYYMEPSILAEVDIDTSDYGKDFLPVDIDGDGDTDIFYATNDGEIIILENTGNFTVNGTIHFLEHRPGRGAIAIDGKTFDGGFLDFASGNIWCLSQGDDFGSYYAVEDPYISMAKAAGRDGDVPPCLAAEPDGSTAECFLADQEFRSRLTDMRWVTVPSQPEEKYVFWLHTNASRFEGFDDPRRNLVFGTISVAPWKEVLNFIHALKGATNFLVAGDYSRSMLDALPFVTFEKVWEFEGRFNHLEIADVDGDGYLDMVAAGSKLMIWYGRPNDANDTLPSISLYFEEEPAVLYESFFLESLSLEDFDGDRTIDIVFSVTSEGHILLNKGSRQYEDVQFFQKQNTTDAYEMGILQRFRLTDVNGDNYTDILMTDFGELYVATQEPPSTSTLSSTEHEISFLGEHGDELFLDNPGGFSVVHTVDLDGDGLEEILYINHYDRDRKIYMIRPSYTYPPSSQPSMAPTSNAEHLYSKWTLFSWTSMMFSIVMVVTVVFF